jgi:hypothetical protein
MALRRDALLEGVIPATIDADFRPFGIAFRFLLVLTAVDWPINGRSAVCLKRGGILAATLSTLLTTVSRFFKTLRICGLGTGLEPSPPNFVFSAIGIFFGG